MLIAENLYLDVTRPSDVALEEHAIIGKPAQRFALCRLERVREVARLVHDAHPFAAAARRRLNHEGIADALGVLGPFTRFEYGHARRSGEILGRQFVADGGNHARGRSDPYEARVDDGACKVRVLREKAVARVDRLSATEFRGRDDGGAVEVTRGQQDGFIGLGHEGRVRVRRHVDRDGAQARLARGAKNTPRNLAAIGHEDRRESHRRNTP